MKTTLLSLVLIVGGASMAQSPATSNRPIPPGMKQYFLAFLIEGKQSAPGPQADQLMRQHLSYISSNVENGTFPIVGHLPDNGRIAGIAVIKAATMEEAARIFHADPMVASGAYSAELHPMITGDLSCVRMDFPKPGPK